MKKVWTAVMFLAMALGVGAVRAQDDADAAKAAEAAAAAAAKAKRIRDRSCLGIASRALCIAKNTPDEKIGSTNANASPAMIQRGPVIFRQA